MAEISPEQVGRLLEATRTHEEAAAVAAAAREALDVTLLDVARQAKVGLRELAAVTGLHHSSIRAGIQRAAGGATIDFEQPELDFTSLGAPVEVMPDQSRVRLSFPRPPSLAPAEPTALASERSTSSSHGRRSIGGGIER